MAYKNKRPSLDIDNAEVESQLVVAENGYTAKKSVYFAFIDVLGFKNAFNENRTSNNEDNNNFDEKFKDVFKYYFSLMSNANFANSDFFYAGQTSDSLYFYTDNENILIEFLKIFSHFNAYAMTRDVFFRGGIANGSLSLNARYQFYGESVIWAYLLESEISKNPIITIDEKTFYALSSFPERDDLIEYKNGRHRLIPFAYLQHKFELDINQSLELKKIDQTKIEETINENMKKFEYDIRIYPKFDFLSDEFNTYFKN